ncbi:DUF2971 domain-containing protein [Acinetobacter nosocomialis]|uniref:DUF2971 domain-containing protein n=1 Tax=Acinetobacter nosocomialis TaxID=106654 RepID=UPI00148EF489|nr:DUF2971 domain-containing protein [Acinetobacter nosocomialis]
MSSNLDDKIKEWIRNEKFSQLSFLDDEWSSSENKNYHGYYYFILSIKNENNNFVFNEIVEVQGSVSNAYYYLGEIAHSIYNAHRSKHIALNFFYKATEIDNNNAKAHWAIFHYSHNLSSLVNALKIFKINGELNKIKNLLFFSPGIDDLSELDSEDLLLLKNIFCEKIFADVRGVIDLLILVYFHLKEFESGILLINKKEKISYKILKKYLDLKLIPLDMVINKLNVWDFDKIVNDDNEKIYELYLIEAAKGFENPIKDVLVSKAYLAKKYSEVIEHFEDGLQSNKLINLNESKLYYLLAQVNLNHKIDNKIYDDVRKYMENLNSLHENKNIKFLYSYLKFLLLCQDLEKKVDENYFSDFPIEVYSNFQKVEEILDSAEIINSKEYEVLKEKLYAIKNKNDLAQTKEKFNKYNEISSLDSFNQYEFLSYCFSGITCKEYKIIINHINVFHENNKPTMSSYNLLGVCYEYEKEYNNALFSYGKALELMRVSKEKNYTIIQNYVNCYEKTKGHKVVGEEYDLLRTDFNLALIHSFKWNDFHLERFNTLYKYSPFNINTIDALTSQYFFLPSKKQLNDPIELPDLSKIQPNTYIFDKYYICSFSNNKNSMLMWSHYAQQHQGIMVEYFFGGELPFGFGISKVAYADDIKRQKDKDKYIFNQFLLTKNQDWSYENEVRLFTFLRQKVEFESYKYPNPDRSKINASIRSITLGLNFPEDKKKLLGNLIKTLNFRRLSYEPEIIVKQAYLCDENSYSLKYREIQLD